MKRYSAKLLFQWRPVRHKFIRRRRLCEERIVTFEARSPKTALTKAKRLGAQSEFDHPIPPEDGGGHVYFEFVGVRELLDLGIECEANEVWWDIVEMREPMERRRTLIPAEGNLRACQKTFGRKRGRLHAW